MHLSGKVWSCLSYLANILTLSSIDQPNIQQPIGLGGHVRPIGNAEPPAVPDHPVFKPPTGRLYFEGSEFECQYPDMPDYVFCGHEPNNRGCWLRPKDPKSKLPIYDINTDYETMTPKGRLRNYTFTVKDGWVNADGMNFTKAKLVNDQYPGPWIQACWGDRIVVTVNNQLEFNGTAIHWHGIRQHETMHMDGVPGITQCPIAPNDTFVYNFAAKQYGSAWYHSHYSVQYADGMLGPLTIHGPHSGDFDEPKQPLLMTDWFHNSAYQVIHKRFPGYPTVLLNGTGDITKYNYSTLQYDRELVRVKNDSSIPPQYRIHFNQTLLRPGNPEHGKRPPRYLLSLMNTAFDTTFVFSIDHHILQVISADFVPIKPYNTTHLHIGIGQRYNVIVEAKPVAYKDDNYKGEDAKSFWIRTTAAPCFGRDDKLASLQGYDETGVLTYKPFEDDDLTKPHKPSTKRWPMVPELPICKEENATNLVPIFPWKVEKPVNGHFQIGNVTDEVYEGERVDVVGKFMFKGKYKPEFDKDFPLATFSIEHGKDLDSFIPMQINYTNPIFLHLNDSQKMVEQWPKKWSVIPENYKTGSWIWLTIAGRHDLEEKGKKTPGYTGGAHPMHLHGHDFAILQQAYDQPLNFQNWKPNTNNPARRDVVLLPANGFVIIAFKVDNPGSWIMHCHIAFHASEGLALQIMENQQAADILWPPTNKAIPEAKRVCKQWKDWQQDCTKHYPGWNDQFKCYPACNNATSSLACPNLFQDDSGI